VRPQWLCLAGLLWAGASGCAGPRSVAGPPPAALDAEQVLEGELEVTIVDADRGSATLYFLVRDRTRIPLEFAGEAPDLLMGTRVRVSGRRAVDGVFHVARIQRLPDR